MELLKLLSTSEIVAQIISFLLLFFLLRIFAWKRLLAILDERKERVASDFRKIDDAKKEIEKLKADYSAKLSDIESMARAKIQEAIVEGRRITDQIKKDAHQQAQKIMDDAKEDIKYEIAKSKVELKDAIVDLVMKSTESIIEENLTPEGDRRIIEKFIERIENIEK